MTEKQKVKKVIKMLQEVVNDKSTIPEVKKGLKAAIKNLELSLK